MSCSQGNLESHFVAKHSMCLQNFVNAESIARKTWYHPIFLFLFQLSELEHRVIEAETRADDAEGKVRKKPINYNYDCTYV